MFFKFALLALFFSFLHAGSITGISVSSNSYETTANATYTFTFTPQTTINSSTWDDGAYFIFDLDNDYTVSSATLGSITPNVTGMNITSRSDSQGRIMMYSSNSGAVITGGQSYTVVINNIQNPTTAQTPVNHVIQTNKGSGTLDQGQIAATPITAAASNPPTVSSQIPDKSNLYESDGALQYVSDLNDNFTDSDGDTLTFTVSSSDSSTVSASTSGTNGQILTITANKHGYADITVTATSSDGSVDDTFRVYTIGEIPVSSVSESSLETTATSSYTFVFTPETTVNSSNWIDGAYFVFDLDNDFTVSSSTLGSISPAISGMSINSRSDSLGRIQMYTNSGAITGGTTYTVVINNIQNPTSAQTPVNHKINTGDGADIIDYGEIAAHTITTAVTNPPTVSLAIPNKSNLRESDGALQYIADLNNHFTDSDGDTLTFTASSSDASVVSVSTSGTNGRILTLQAHKYGMVDINVTATASDGAVSDTFSVSTIGALTINSITSSSDVASYTTDITVNFTLEQTVSDAGGDGAYLYFDLPVQYGVDDNTTVNVTSPSISGSSHRDSGSSNVWFIASASTIAAGTYTAVISNVTNPSSGGSYGNLLLDTRDGGSTTFDEGSLTLPSIAAGSLPTVSTPIPDQIDLKESDGLVEVISNLNDNFTDGNGDTLSFSLNAIGDGSIANIILSGTDNRVLSILPLKAGSTTVTIRASDGIHGTVDDTFNVTTIGELLDANITPESFTTASQTTIDVMMINEAEIPYLGEIIVDFPDTFDVTQASLTDFNASGSTAGISSVDTVNAKVYITLTSGPIITSTTVSFSLSDIVTPTEGGDAGAYTITTTDGSTTLDEKIVQSDTFTTSSSFLPTIYYLLLN